MLFFGEFLIERSYITQEQLVEGLALQRAANRPLGKLAVSAGLLTENQVESLYAKQQFVDKPLGEIAVESGELTHQQVDELLFDQVVSHVYIGEAVLQLGYLQHDQYVKLLKEYEQWERERRRDTEALLSKSGRREMLIAFIEAMRRVCLRFFGLEVKAVGAWSFDKQPCDHGMSITVEMREGTVLEGRSCLPDFLLERIHARFAEAEDPIQTFMNVVETYIRMVFDSLGHTTTSCVIAPVSMDALVPMEDGVNLLVASPFGSMGFTLRCASGCEPESEDDI